MCWDCPSVWCVADVQAPSRCQDISKHHDDLTAGLILGLRPANERHDVSHWLGASPESALHCDYNIIWIMYHVTDVYQMMFKEFGRPENN